MQRQFNDIRWLCRSKCLIMPCTMSSMHFRVVQGGFWWLGARRERGQHLLISFQQDKDGRDNLTCNPPDDFQASGRLVCFLVETAFALNQPCIDLGPFTVVLPDHLPNDQQHRALHLPLPTKRVQEGPGSRLTESREKDGSTMIKYLRN